MEAAGCTPPGASVTILPICTAACLQAPGVPPRYARSWVEELNAQGFSVCGIDQQGCGFSGGLECYVERFDDYVDDVLQFARHAASCLRGPLSRFNRGLSCGGVYSSTTCPCAGHCPAARSRASAGCPYS